METRPSPTAPHPVITLHYDCDLVAEVLNAGVGNNQPGGPGQPQREVLVPRVTIPFTRRRFENMRSGNTARWNAPPFALEEKSGLGLRAGEAELSRVLSAAPCRMIRTQRTQPLGNFILGKPFDFLGNCVRLQCFKAFRANKLNSACAVFSYMGDQPKDILRRNLKTPAPVLKNPIIVGQQSP